MDKLSRRDLLKTSLLAPAVAVAAQGVVGKGVTRAGTPGGLAAAVAPHSSGIAGSAGQGGERERLLMDFGWRFHFGHANDSDKDFGYGDGFTGNFLKTGNFIPAAALAYDDSDWRPLDLPHDWAVELPFQNDPALAGKGFYPLGRNYPATSVGWYRRVFELPAADAGRRISIEFDGSYRETTVIFNGCYLGRHSGGYDPFSFDLTDFANPGGRNVLVVRVDATLSDGWFYEGAGIYRHVWLVKTRPVHVQRWGTLVHSWLQGDEASVYIRTELNNHGKSAPGTRVTSTVLDPSGKTVSKSATGMGEMPEWGERIFEQRLAVSNPALWSLEQCNLYKLVTQVDVEGEIVDHYETPFGIRTIIFEPSKGCFLNGQPIKLKGTCNHQDHAGLGVALPDAVQHYRIRKLKEMGSNALRTSHNPPTPELLDACDQLGMLVFDETRMMSSNPEGLSQFRNLVRRDRNHPSVFMWSMGNEEGQANTEKGLRILTAMKQVAMHEDGSRLVSIAPIRAIGVGGLTVCDVMGYNYADPPAEAYHKAHPEVPMMGTENVSAVATRGIYVMDHAKGYVGSYDTYTTTGRASAEGWWRFCNARPWLAGGFVWTGFDYRGEPSPYQWPNISSQYGIIDTCGFPKDPFYYYQSWWTSEPVLHLFPHWNWPGLEGKQIAVWVYSNFDRVELFLNGQSLGAKEMPKDSHLAWLVKYAPGAIEARGYKGGQMVKTAKRETTGPAAKLAIKPDRADLAADGQDVAMFAVELFDAQGRMSPTADNEVTFKISGEGKLIGVGNGDPTSHELDKGTTRKAFNGLCMGIVQSTKRAGNITVEVLSPGLAPATVTIATRAARLEPEVGTGDRAVPQGSGITGLWRPVPKPGDTGGQLALAGAGGNMVFAFHQEGNTLTGTVEGAGGVFADGNRPPLAIEDGKVDGNRITFHIGNISFNGTLTGEQIELAQKVPPPNGMEGPPSETPAGVDVAIGSRLPTKPTRPAARGSVAHPSHFYSVAPSSETGILACVK